MKLELKHLAPYLPYKLNCMAQGEDKQSFEFQGVSDVTWIDLHEIGRTVCDQYDIEDVFPILRPLSDLTKSELIELRFDEGNDTLLWAANNIEAYDCFIQFYETDLTYSVLEWAYKKHLDVFGLIEKGLAIDINTI
mgnify:CR=1 FL=1